MMNETPEVLDVIANALGIYADTNDDQLLDEILTKIRGLQVNLDNDDQLLDEVLATIRGLQLNHDKEILRDAERREDAVLELAKVLTVQIMQTENIYSAGTQTLVANTAVGLYDAMEAALYPGAIEDQPEQPKKEKAPAHHITCRYCEGNGFIKFHGVPTTCGKCLGQGYYT